MHLGAEEGPMAPPVREGWGIEVGGWQVEGPDPMRSDSLGQGLIAQGKDSGDPGLHCETDGSLLKDLITTVFIFSECQVGCWEEKAWKWVGEDAAVQ